MKVRGHRECKECGERWSYYETGSVECPECGSLRSVGVDERQLHTASPVSLDLGPARRALGTEPTETVAREAAETAASFVRRDGFIDGGDLRPLTDEFVTATELRHVGGELARSLRITDSEEQYLLSLLASAETGDRPPRDDLPTSLEGVHGFALASAVGDYRRDLLRYLDEHPDAEARRTLGVLEDHRTRIEALDGNVDPETAEALVTAARAIGAVLRNNESSLDPARQALSKLDPD